MKKKFTYLLIVASFMCILLNSCDKDYLEVYPKGLSTELNYYQSEEQLLGGLMSIYSILSNEDGWSVNLIGLNAAADECWTGGGGASDYAEYQAWGNFSMTAVLGPSLKFWDSDYKAIYRANVLIQKIGTGVTGVDKAVTDRMLAEVKTLRAYFYFELINMFYKIPLILEPLEPIQTYSVTQVERSAVWTQIEKDLNEAIPNLPTKSSLPLTELARISKESAMAILGKVILYQNNTTRMAEAAGWFNKVNTATGFILMSNFGDIFDPAKKFNSESVLEITHTGSMKTGNWGAKQYGNLYVIAVGPRSYKAGPGVDDQHNYIAGWSFNPPTLDFVNFMKEDPRFKYTISNLDSLVIKYGCEYSAGYQNTGYFIQKYAPLEKWRAKSGTTELNFPNDWIVIRLADTYLLEAEALVRSGSTTTRAKELLDLVRSRVGLTSVPATLDNIYNERRLELATEGHRWHDLIRTGQAASKLAFKGFIEGKHNFLPIPKSSLDNTKLVQDPAY